MHTLDIVLPCYNPVANWAETIIEQVNHLKELLDDTKIYVILVNDGSNQEIKPEDLSILNLSLENFSYITYPFNKGKGYALRKGVNQAQHAICIYTDVDFPYQVESMAHLYYHLIKEDTDIAVGIRDEQYYKHLTGARSLLSKILKYFNSKVFNLPVNDTQCGIKGFNLKGRALFLSTQQNRYLIDLEFVFLASSKAELNFKAIPVKLRTGLTFRSLNSKILIHESINFIKLFFKSI